MASFLLTSRGPWTDRVALAALLALLPLASQAQLATAVNFSTGSGSSSRGITSTDINGDGKLDVVTVNYNTNTFGVLVNTTAVGATTPTFGSVFTFATGGTTPTRVVAADFNADGKPDLFTVHSNSAVIGVLLNTTAANATTPTFAPLATFSSAAGSYSVGVAAADINGDGKLDIVTSNAVNTGTSASVSVLRNTTAPGATTLSFALATEFTLSLPVVGTGAYGVVTPDINGDGRPDIATVNHSANSASVLLNTTAANATTITFSTPLTLSTGVGSTPFNIATADVNADGKPDLLTANSANGANGNAAGVFLNTTAAGAATASFAPIATFAVGAGTTNPRGIAAADVNGDGKPDVLTANSGTSNSVGVLINTTAAGATTPTFAAVVNASVGTGTAPITIATADINGDGKPDALTANLSGNSAGVLLNQYGTTLTGLSVSSGPVGSSVTLTGSNFTNASTVSFNGTAATSVTFNSATSLTAVVPAGATTGNVTVTTASITTAGLTFTVITDLVLSTPTNVVGGTYRNITVQGGGRAIFTGDVAVTGTFRAEAGGVVQFTDGTNCHTLSGSGAFVLEAFAQINPCSADGIAASGATGNVLVTGTRTYSSQGIYLYDGTVAQVTGSGMPAQVAALGVFGSQPLTLSQPVAVEFQLIIFGAGNIVTGGQALTLLSNATNTAIVVNVSTGRVVGNTTVQRYITPTPGGLGYRFFSAPVENTTVADLAAPGFTPLVNGAYNTAGNPLIVRPYPNVFGFDQARPGASFDKGYYSPTPVGAPTSQALTATLTPGRGYSVYSPAATYDFVGTLTTGTVPVSGLVKTGTTPQSGWHLLGNPYPSVLDWDRVTTPTGMSNTIYVMQATGTSQSAYVYLTRQSNGDGTGTGTLPDGLLATAQGFFAQVSSTTPVSFSFTDAHRETTVGLNPVHYRQPTATLPTLSLVLRDVTATAPLAQDAAFVVFHETGASADYEEHADAVRPGRNSGVPTLAALLPTGEELAIDGRSTAELAAGTLIELLAVVPAAGTYQLTVGQLDGLASTAVMLRDRLTGTAYDLATQPTVRFTTTQAGDIAGRFALEINLNRVTGLPATPASALKLTVWPNPTNWGAVRVLGASVVGHPATITDATGRVVRQATVSAEGTLDVANLPAGVYAVRVGAATARLVLN